MARLGVWLDRCPEDILETVFDRQVHDMLGAGLYDWLSKPEHADKPAQSFQLWFGAKRVIFAENNCRRTAKRTTGGKTDWTAFAKGLKKNV